MPKRKADRGQPPRHGFYKLRSAGTRVLDRRTRLARALRDLRCELVAGLGGEGEISAQEKMILGHVIDRACLIAVGQQELERRLQEDEADGLLIRSEDGDTRLQKLVDDVERLKSNQSRDLVALGLKRRKPEPVTLSAYCREKYGTNGGDAETLRKSPGAAGSPVSDASSDGSNGAGTPLRAPEATDPGEEDP